MKIDFAMIWDQFNMKYPGLETSVYDSHPVCGIKLLPSNNAIEPDYLYVSQCSEGSMLSCGGVTDIIDSALPLDILFNELQDIFNRLRDWDMETHLALIEGCDPQKLLNLSQEILGNPITLMDPSYKLLAITSHKNAASSIFNQVRQLGYLPAETVVSYLLRGYMDALVESGDEIAFQSDSSVITVIYPLRISNAIVGYLTMPCTERAYSQGIAECFRYLADVFHEENGGVRQRTRFYMGCRINKGIP